LTITLEDLEAVIDDEFFQLGRYYFEGIWKQAAENPPGQQEILKAFAFSQDGLIEAQLLQITSLSLQQLREAIETLKRHDVIQETEGRFKIVVELLRRWLIASLRT